MRKIAKVRFVNIKNTKAKIYYFYTDILDLEEGDLIVVNVENETKIVPAYFQSYVTTAYISVSNIEVEKWIVGKLDLSSYQYKLEEINNRTAIYNRIDEIIENSTEEEKYEIFANGNSEIKKLLKCLDELNK